MNLHMLTYMKSMSFTFCWKDGPNNILHSSCVCIRCGRCCCSSSCCLQGGELGAQYKNFSDHEFLDEHIETVTVADDLPGDQVDLDQCQLCLHVYQCHQGKINATEEVG